MKEKLNELIIRLIKNQLVKGSTALFFGNIVANFGNYLYHLLMGRMLKPIDYGALESVISLVYFFGIPLTAVNLVVVKAVSDLRGRGQEREVVSFYHHLTWKLLWIILGGAVFFASISPLIKNFLHLDSLWPILAIISFSFLNMFNGINLAVIRAYLKFKYVSLTGIFQVIGKLSSALFLVALGFSVFGASSAFFIGSIFGFAFSRFYLKKILGSKGKNIYRLRLEKMAKEVLPFFILTLSFTSLYTVDVVLARHFLASREAGFYAALSVLSKIIFFACGPVIQVMFPIVSARHASGGSYQKLFFLSLFLVFLICLGIGGVYFFLPHLMVKALFGVDYLGAARYLGIFALFLSFYSLASLMTQFFLSISKNKIIFLPLAAAAAQIIFLALFHQSLVQMAWVSTIICGLLLGFLIIYIYTDSKMSVLKILALVRKGVGGRS